MAEFQQYEGFKGIARGLRPREFTMKNEDGLNPCSRFLAIWTEDLWRIGDFETFAYIGEDRDFWFRAIHAGMRWIPIVCDMMVHIPHIRREKNRAAAIKNSEG